MANLAAPTLADGRYTIVRQLGEGGMATVFLAWDSKLKVWRAVKALLPDFVSKAKIRRRFENEAHAMARLEHPHIIRVYDVGLEDGAPYMVMEFAQGGCVIDWLETYGAMPPKLAAEVTIQISKGIHAAHDAGIVHRDIKPHNILVTHKGVCKMTDFGIAQVMENDSLTKTGSVMGTWGYMAPEQRTDAKAVDERADIFGLGATLYAMLTNKTPTELYVADEDDDVFDGVEPPMLEVILKACSYKAAQRYPTVKAFARAVRDAAAHSRPSPDDTPELILPSDPVPESIESVEVPDERVLELITALGVSKTDEPTVQSEPGRVLPYYADPSASGVPTETASDHHDEPTEERDLTASDLADFLQSELPSYIDVEDYQASQPLRAPEPEVAFEPLVHEEPAAEFAGFAPEPESTAPEEAPEPPAVVEPESASVTVVDILLRAAVVPLVFALGVLGVLAWGMVTVNGAHDEALLASRPLHAAMNSSTQGPIIDGLALAGADKAELERLLQAYKNGEGDRMVAARDYVNAVQSAARAGAGSPVVNSVLPSITELTSAERMYANAEAEWAASGAGFPGVFAVTLGLSVAP